jgi:hypothetical protein
MTHRQWAAAIRKSLVMIERQPARALASLDRLLARLESAALKGVGDWHIEQTLETVSIIHSHRKEHRQSATMMLRIAERLERQERYYRRAFVAACAAAALELVAAGDRSGAAHVLQKARKLAAGLQPPDKLFRKAERVVAAMRRKKSTLALLGLVAAAVCGVS